MTNSIVNITESKTMKKNSENTTTCQIARSLKKRHTKEKRFKFFGLMAIAFGFLMVFILLTDITTKAQPAFFQYWVKVDIDYNEKWLGVDSNNKDSLGKASYRKVVKKSIMQMFPEVSGRGNTRDLAKLFSSEAEFQIKRHLLENPSLLGTKTSVWILADDDFDTYLKSPVPVGEVYGRINELQAKIISTLVNTNKVEERFNTLLFTNSDSREPELAGIKGALTGTIFTLFITLIISFPIGVASALYLEEFAPKNRFTDIIEVNINNLAAVPSIVFGLLGLAVIINIFGLPRSAPLVGGIVLSLMTLPTIIIASRASIKAVPNSIREAAIGLGASKMQVALGHVLPLAMPGILTGAIIGLAQALGETAPLLMIGMVAFIVDVPTGFVDAATVMPVQIFLWADSPEQAFTAKTSAAILVLLVVLLVMNLSAALLRRKFEKLGK